MEVNNNMSDKKTKKSKQIVLWQWGTSVLGLKHLIMQLHTILLQ